MSMPVTDLQSTNYVIEWIIRLAALAVVPRRRAPAPTSAWLLLIFFLPIPGFILFLVIGGHRFPQWRAERFQQILPLFERVAAHLTAAAPPGPDVAPDIAQLSRNLGHFPAVTGCSVEVIDDYDEVIDLVTADIDGARDQVRLLVYIFADDSIGQIVIAALRRAVARGVACHVMVDAVGSKPWINGTLRLLREAGVDVVVALPFHPLRGFTRRDMRNHRKLFLIDNEIGFAGSQNIVAKDFRPGIVNRELVLRVTGPIVAAMEAVARGDWYLETEKMPADLPPISPATGKATCQLLPSGANYPLQGFETLLVWQIHQARTRVVIVTPYFIPDEGVLGAMRTAVARGVTVELIVSAAVDQRLVNLAQCSYYDDLLVAGVHIYLFREFLLHAKNISIDGRLAIVGSSNVDVRSFQLNEETSLLLFDPASVMQVEAVQRGYVRNSDALLLDPWRKRSAAHKMGENVARLVSALL